MSLEEATKRIEAAKAENRTLLYLTDLGLTEVPESVGQLPSLTTLNLSGNELLALPEWFGQLTNLTNLYVSGNQLTEVPKSIDQLTNLEVLGLGRNQLTSVPEWFGQLTKLTMLFLNDNQLGVVPESISQLTNIEKGLWLDGNQLSVLPDWMGQLTNLRELHLSGNELSVLPESIGRLANLEMLELRGNQLLGLPESLGQLTSLERLRIYNNPLPSTLVEAIRVNGVSGLRRWFENSPQEPPSEAADTDLGADLTLKQRSSALGFQIPEITAEVERAVPEIASLIDTYGLPPELGQIITQIRPVEIVEVNRQVTLPEGVRQVDSGVLISTVRDRQLIIDIASAEVLFFTPQRDYRMNLNFEAFIRCAVTYLEPPEDLRAAIEAADPTALFDINGLWEEVVDFWEVHQD